ncbi:MAG: hypothetical protein DDT26_01699 [Dehalococcoidia bacterium]|nr:hypothetical protein [Chloroflexota bacterium]
MIVQHFILVPPGAFAQLESPSEGLTTSLLVNLEEVIRVMGEQKIFPPAEHAANFEALEKWCLELPDQRGTVLKVLINMNLAEGLLTFETPNNSGTSSLNA